MLKSGVYCIENIYNGKMYIGSSFDIHRRLVDHFGLMRRNKSHNNHLQASFNKYGKEAFIGYVVELCGKNRVKDREQFWIDNTSCLINGFNQSKKAYDNSGWNHSEELKAKLSNERMGVGNPMYGVKLSEEQREGIKQRSTGRWHRQQAIDKMIANRAKNKQKYVGSKSGKAILNEKKVYEIKIHLSKGLSFSKLAKKFKISDSAIAGIFNNRRWQHVICDLFDNYKKGYQINSRQQGELNLKSKLTETNIREIRSISGKSYAAIGRIYNVSDVTISNIIKMKIWKNVV